MRRSCSSARGHAGCCRSPPGPGRPPTAVEQGHVVGARRHDRPWARSRKRLARAYLKPEYWVPAMGWPPTKVKPRPLRRAACRPRTTARFTPQAVHHRAASGLHQGRRCRRSQAMAGARVHARAGRGRTAGRRRRRARRRSVATRAAPMVSSSRSKASTRHPGVAVGLGERAADEAQPHDPDGLVTAGPPSRRSSGAAPPLTVAGHLAPRPRGWRETLGMSSANWAGSSACGPSDQAQRRVVVHLDLEPVGAGRRWRRGPWAPRSACSRWRGWGRRRRAGA